MESSTIPPPVSQSQSPAIGPTRIAAEHSSDPATLRLIQAVNQLPPSQVLRSQTPLLTLSSRSSPAPIYTPTAPSTASKRSHARVEDLDEAEAARQKRKEEHNKKRPRYRDYDGNAELSLALNTVKNDLQVHFATVCPFPDLQERDCIVRAKFAEICDEQGVTQQLTKDLLTLVRALQTACQLLFTRQLLVSSYDKKKQPYIRK